VLVLPEQWRTWHGGAVACELLKQVRTRKLHIKAAQHFIGASLDLFVATWPGWSERFRVRTLRGGRWRIAKLLYVYVPRLDDRSVERCAALARESDPILIVPPRHEGVLSRSLEVLLRRGQPVVARFDNFIAWRTASASVDKQWPRGVAEISMFKAYNRRVAEAGDDESIMIDIPPDAE
jgi:hypothetical protein